MTSLVERLILDYADACFRCGEYPGDSAARYRELSQHRALTHEKLSAELTRLQAERASDAERIEAAQHIIGQLRAELEAARAVTAEYDAWIRFHDAGEGDFKDFIRKLVCESGAEVMGTAIKETKS
jgi:hypothetical protein